MALECDPLNQAIENKYSTKALNNAFVLYFRLFCKLWVVCFNIYLICLPLNAQVKLSLKTSLVLQNAIYGETVDLRLEENGFSSYYASALRNWDANGTFKSKTYYYGYFSKGLFHKPDSFFVLQVDERGALDDKLLFIRDGSLFVYGENGETMYRSRLGKAGWYIDEVKGSRGLGELHVFSAYNALPVTCFSQKTNKLFLSLRYDYYDKKPEGQSEIARVSLQRFDSAQYRPSLPPLAVFDLSQIDAANLKPPEDKYRAYRDEWRYNRIPAENKFGYVPDTFMRLYRNESKFFPQGRNIAFGVDEATETVFLQYMALPEIRAYSFDGKEKAVFGLPGKYAAGAEHRLVSWAELEPESVSKFNGLIKGREATDYVYAAWYLSPEYLQLYADTLNKLVYRTYKVSPKNERTLEKLVELQKKADEKFWDLDRNKPTYLQIYDAADGYKLIYDEPVPAPFHIIGTDEKGFLWAVTGWSDDGVEVSKYKIER